MTLDEILTVICAATEAARAARVKREANMAA